MLHTFKASVQHQNEARKDRHITKDGHITVGKKTKNTNTLDVYILKDVYTPYGYTTGHVKVDKANQVEYWCFQESSIFFYPGKNLGTLNIIIIHLTLKYQIVSLQHEVVDYV